MNFAYTTADTFALLPALILAIVGCGLFVVDATGKESLDRKWLLGLMTAGLALAGAGLWKQQTALGELGLWNNPGGILEHGPAQIFGFGGAIVGDGFSIFFNWIFLAASFLVAVASYKYLDIEGEHHGEYYGLILLANCGMFFLATGADLITLFVGLELMALCFYILVGFSRRDKRSNEAAMKYLLLGAFSSGFLVYGFSVLYGISGSTRLTVIAAAIASREPWDPVVFLALATTAAGLLFKISAVPFHMWAPDAYEGAPTTITAYLAVGSKAASFAFLLRMFLGPFASLRDEWVPLLAAIAIATMTLGNITAVNQTNIKRLLAYSSISHAGYILLGLIAGNETGIKGVAVYLLVYVFMTLGAFLVVIALRRKGILGEDIDDLSGLMHKAPGYAILMLIFMASLAGIPFTGGFWGKFYIFLSLIQTGHYVLAVVATLYVAVALYYYFRVVRSMFVSAQEDKVPLASSVGLRFALGAAGLMTLAVGIYPEPFLRMAQISTSLIPH